MGAWLHLVVFGSLIAFNAQLILLARASAGPAASYAFVDPVIALAPGVTLGGGVVSACERSAAGVVLVGVVLLLLEPAPR